MESGRELTGSFTEIPVCGILSTRASLGAQMIRNLPAVRETWIQSLGREDPLEKGTATPSNILALIIPWTEEPDGLQSIGSQRVRYDMGD